MAEPLKEVRGTPGFRGTPVEKHCVTEIFAAKVKNCFKSSRNVDVFELTNFMGVVPPQKNVARALSPQPSGTSSGKVS